MSLRAIVNSIAGAFRTDPTDADVIPFVADASNPQARGLRGVSMGRLASLFGGGWTAAIDAPAPPGDATTALAARSAQLEAGGRRYLFAPPGSELLVNDGLANLRDVIHVSDGGRYTGTTILQPNSPFLGSRFPGANDVIPSAHLPRMRATIAANEVVTVVFMGDSIAAGADLINAMEGYTGYIRRRFLECNPGVTFRFVDRAVPGARWDKFNDLSLLSVVGAAGWVTGDYLTKTWFEAVEEDAPTVVVALFGMNGHLAPDVIQGVNLLRTMSPAPDVILGTNYLPTVQDPTNTLGTVAVAINSRMSAAGSTRTAAALLGCGLLDFHRQHCIAQHGFDPRQIWLERTVANAAISLPYSTPGVAPAGTSPAWAFRINLPAGFYNAPFAITIGNDLRNLFVIERDAGGNLAVEGVFVGRASWLPRAVTAHAAPSAASTLEVTMKDGFLRAAFPLTGSSPERILYEGLALRQGGSHRLRINRFDLATNDVTLAAVSGLTLVYLLEGRYQPFTPYLTDMEMYAAGQGGPVGGSGINHQTHIANALVAGPVVDQANLCGL